MPAAPGDCPADLAGERDKFSKTQGEGVMPKKTSRGAKRKMTKKRARTAVKRKPAKSKTAKRKAAKRKTAKRRAASRTPARKASRKPAAKPKTMDELRKPALELPPTHDTGRMVSPDLHVPEGQATHD